MKDLKYFEMSAEAMEFLKSGGAEMAEEMMVKVKKVSEHIGMVVELDLLLLDDNTRDDYLLEQICNDHNCNVDIDVVQSYVSDVRIHMDSGFLLGEELRDIIERHSDAKDILNDVHKIMDRNDRLSLGLDWDGIHNDW